MGRVLRPGRVDRRERDPRHARDRLTADRKIPIDSGVAGPKLACSNGALAGCIGTLTARMGSKTVASVTYQLAPKESNSFSFASESRSGAGDEVEALRAAVRGQDRAADLRRHARSAHRQLVV
jgi:hypothetical protein